MVEPGLAAALSRRSDACVCAAWRLAAEVSNAKMTPRNLVIELRCLRAAKIRGFLGRSGRNGNWIAYVGTRKGIKKWDEMGKVGRQRLTKELSGTWDDKPGCEARSGTEGGAEFNAKTPRRGDAMGRIGTSRDGMWDEFEKVARDGKKKWDEMGNVG